MAIDIETSLWRLHGSDEPRTLMHINRKGAYQVSRKRGDFPPTAELTAMPEKDFNEMCRVSWHKTALRPD